MIGTCGLRAKHARAFLILCSGALALALTAGLAGAAPGHGHGHRDRISYAPLGPDGTPGASHLRAGFKQHVPTNLAGLKAPPGRKADTAKTSSLKQAARALAAVPPAPTITSKPANPTFDTTATFTFSDSLAGVTFQCRLDSASFATCKSPKSYPGPLLAGAHTFRVRAVSGRWTSGQTTYSWTVSKPPAPSLTTAPPNPTSGRAATFAFTDSLAGVKFQCRLDSAALAACTSPVKYAGPLALGNHTFGVQAVNGAGTSAQTTFTWTISTTAAPPATPTITAQPASSTTDTTATFSFTDTAANVSYSCKLDGAAFVPCTSPTTYSSLALGGHTFAVIVTDAAGATSAPATYTWTITASGGVKMRLLVISGNGSEQYDFASNPSCSPTL